MHFMRGSDHINSLHALAIKTQVCNEMLPMFSKRLGNYRADVEGFFFVAEDVLFDEADER